MRLSEYQCVSALLQINKHVGVIEDRTGWAKSEATSLNQPYDKLCCIKKYYKIKTY